jgi:tetratricopeptide (TPR) repeat protein
MHVNRSHIALVILLLIAFAIRMGYIFEIREEPHTYAPAVDAGFHDLWAKRVAKGDPGDLPFFRAPLYPWLLGGVYFVFGDSPFPPRILQALLSTLTVMLIWFIARRLFGPTAGWISAITYTIFGLGIFFVGELLITTLIVFLDTLALWLVVRYYDSKNWWLWGIVGLVLGLSAIARPSILIFLPVLSILLWLEKRGVIACPHGRPHVTPGGCQVGTPDSTSSCDTGKALSVKAKAISILAIWLGLMLPILPVTLLNRIGGHEWVLIATQGGINFYIGNNSESTGAHAVLPEFGETWELSDAWSLAKQETGKSLTTEQLSNFYYKKALNWMIHHPVDWLKLMARKTHLFIQYFEISNNRNIYFFANRAAIMKYLLWIGFGLIAPIGLLGMVAGYKHSKESRVIIWFVISYSVGVILFFVTARFRMPVVPELIILGSVVPIRVYEWLREHRYQVVIAFAVGAVALYSLCWWNPYGYSRTPDAQAYFSLGNAYLKLNRYSEARDAFRSALILDPGYKWVHLNIGVSHWRQGNPVEAEKEYRAELELDSLSETAMNNLGVIADQKGDLKAAEQWFRKALKVKPYYNDARVNLAETLFKEGYLKAQSEDFKGAVILFSEAADLAPNRVSYRYNLAVMLAATDKPDEAYQNWEIAHRIDPSVPPLPAYSPPGQVVPDSSR